MRAHGSNSLVVCFSMVKLVIRGRAKLEQGVRFKLSNNRLPRVLGRKRRSDNKEVDVTTLGVWYQCRW